ncbi:MAG: right-handed parallel beta-helix repeat-containing protein [Rickettsiales bacterium]|nr:right-handed parallel beta-helix repeat-containing protein [Rickettsiales bacterium]
MQTAIYNVKDFGAKGDGKTIDTSAIQKALDAAYHAGGGTVIIPEGTYVVTGGATAADGALKVRSNVTIEGEGMGQTIIKLADQWNQKVTGIIRTPSGGDQEHDIVIRNLTIDGNKANNTNPKAEVDGFFAGVTPLSPKYDYNISIDRVEVMNTSRYGFDPHEQIKNLSITNSVAHGNKDGFTIDYISNSVFENNVSYNNSRHGFNVVTSSHDNVLRNNVAYNNGGSGFVTQRGSDDRPLNANIVFEGNTAYGNGEHGILVKLSEDTIVRNNEVYDNQKTGITIEGSRGSVVEGNLVYNNSQAGDGQYSQVEIDRYDDRLGATKGYFDSTDNVIRANVIYSNDAQRADHSIREEDATSRNNDIIGNLTYGAKNGEISVVNAEVVTSTLNPAQLSAEAFLGWSKTTQGYVSHDAPDSGLWSVGNLLPTNVTRQGTDGDNTLAGTGGDDVINARAGDDTVSGGVGQDVIFGGSGKDRINGNDGNDTLHGGSGLDYLSGDAGHDLLYGGTSMDTLSGDSGNDTLVGGDGSDQLIGGSGNDVFVYGRGSDRDTIVDFMKGEDVIDITNYGFTSVGVLLAQTIQTDVNGRLEINFGDGDVLRVAGLTTADLTNDDYFLI